MNNTNKYANGNKYSGRAKTSTAEVELSFVDNSLKFVSMIFGLTRQYLMALAYQLAEINHLDHSFNREETFANMHWYCEFMKRHCELSFHQALTTSTAGARGFKTKSIDDYL